MFAVCTLWLCLCVLCIGYRVPDACVCPVHSGTTYTIVILMPIVLLGIDTISETSRVKGAVL